MWSYRQTLWYGGGGRDTEYIQLCSTHGEEKDKNKVVDEHDEEAPWSHSLGGEMSLDSNVTIFIGGKSWERRGDMST